MIKLPKEIVHMIKTIEDAGFEAYAVGGCVRDSILGKHPDDWDLTSNASRDSLEALFPDAAIVNRKLGVMRVSEGEVAADIAAYRIDGEYKDYRRPETVIFTQELDEDLKRRDFTMNAIAVSPGRGVVDPYHGRDDIEKKLIRGIGDPRIRFEEDALRILRAVRFAAQLGFEVDGGTLLAMKEKVGLLAFISVERIREELTKTVTAGNGGKGLALLMETGALPYIFGKDCVENAAAAELEKLVLLTENIDKTESRLSLRLALLYLCLERDRALAAIELPGWSNEMKKLLQHAVSLSEELDGIRDKADLKRFISRIGADCYRYLETLAEQRCRVWDLGEEGLLLRRELFDGILKNQEPVFIGDLAVNGSDLIERGIKEGAEVGRLLGLLLETVHEAPDKNNKNLLLELAAEKYVET